MVVLALASVASPAAARPKRRDARIAFDRGVAAYKKGNFEAASEALGKSFEAERDVDTLFAWAQSERKLDHCDKAIELYEKLLTFDLPPANKEAVATNLAECRAQAPGNDRKVEPPSTGPAGGAPAAVTPAPEPAPGLAAPATTRGSLPLADTGPEPRVWYRDPITLTLVGSGALAVSVGVGFLASARSADSAFKSAGDYSAAQSLSDKAKSRQKIGLITSGVGGALLVGGVVWIFTHRDPTEQHAVAGWVAPDGGGLAVTGMF
jgi:tetratricopeptide (TPR) repeat protein